MRTHYDNLKVAETATRDEIKASYRKLCLLHHPDRNPDNEDAKRIMQIINDAYDVLYDPVKRRSYDQELLLRRRDAATGSRTSGARGTAHATPQGQQRHETPRQHRTPYETRRSARYAPPPGWHPPGSRSRQVQRSFMERTLLNPRATFTVVFLITCVAAANVFHRFQTDQPSLQFGPRKTSSMAVQEVESRPLFSGPGFNRTPMRMDTPAYQRPATAPNGQPWPENAEYIKGYPPSAIAGQSRVTLNNGFNGSDVVARLVFLRDGKQLPVRTCFLPAHTAFTLMGITP